MKHLLLVVLAVGLAGCQSLPTTTVLPAPTNPAISAPPPPAPPAAAPAPSSAGLEQKIRQQAQYIEALISQNDALIAKLAATPVPATPAASINPLPPSHISLPPEVAATPRAEPAPPPRPPAPVPVSPPPIPLPPEPTLTPNADNVIDLVAVVVAEKSGEPVNPFTVRTVPPESTREVTLQVGGIVAGPVACAIVNDRLVQVGELIESLAIERIEANAVLLRHSGRLLRLPVAEKPVRVRLPL